MPKRRDDLKEALFAAKYVKYNCNGTRALRSLGHKGKPAVLAETASRLLRNGKVQQALAEIRHDATMDAMEALQRMSEIARGTMEDFLSKGPDEGEKVLHLDLMKARRLRKLHLLKSYTEDPNEHGVKRKIELYPADAALKSMMQFLGLLEKGHRDIPKDERELNSLLAAELVRIKGREEGERLARQMGYLPELPTGRAVH